MSSQIVFRPDDTILIKNVRLSYEHVFKPWSMNPGEKQKYSGKFLMPKTTHKAEIQALGSHLMKMCQEKFKSKLPADKLFLRDGDASGKPEQEGHFIVSASEDKKPNVINRDKTPLAEEDDVVYSGCYVHVLIRPWSQANSFGKRINANLLAVQFAKDGERFSGVSRPDVDQVFDDESGALDDATGHAAAGAGSGSGEFSFD
ncbi:MAG: ssDNA-binding protein [Pseudomonadota bacterium]